MELKIKNFKVKNYQNKYTLEEALELAEKVDISSWIMAWNDAYLAVIREERMLISLGSYPSALPFCRDNVFLNIRGQDNSSDTVECLALYKNRKRIRELYKKINSGYPKRLLYTICSFLRKKE